VVARPVELAGPGLFNAAAMHLRVATPASPRGADRGAGLCFRRTDAPGQPVIPALAQRVVQRPRRTVLAPDAAHAAEGLPIETVEHLLSAAAGVGLTDAELLVAGAEVPMLDGSALPFASALLDAGLVEPRADAGLAPPPVRLRAEVRLEEPGPGGSGPPVFVVAQPWHEPELVLTYNLDYGPGSPIPPQSFTWVHRWAAPDAAGYLREVAPARTFATAAEADRFRAQGLFAHLRPGDALVIDHSGPVGTSLRFPDEPARHKVLDMLGDLALAGRPIFARVTATRAGHALNQRLAAALASLP
jgi:UDP-3-O-acyl-N-acetylglucosamine deacetylase